MEKEWWEETLLLYTGLINREWKDKANGIVKEILSGSHDDEKVLRRWMLLGGKALRDIQEYKRDEKVTVLARDKLMTLIGAEIDLKDRFDTGEILGILGDPRIKPPPMVRVEAGEFTCLICSGEIFFFFSIFFNIFFEISSYSLYNFNMLRREVIKK